MTQLTKSDIPVNDIERSRDVYDKIKRLEGLHAVDIEVDSIGEFFNDKKIRRVPLFLETLKNYYTESEASISMSNVKTYDNLHFAREEDGSLIAYVYKSKLTRAKTPTDIMFDRYT